MKTETDNANKMARRFEKANEHVSDMNLMADALDDGPAKAAFWQYAAKQLIQYLTTVSPREAAEAMVFVAEYSDETSKAYFA